MSIKRTVCPECGSRIIVSELYQNSKDYYIKDDGKLSKKYTTQTWMPLEVIVASCENPDCPAHWNDGDFEITQDGEFIDYRYEE